MTQEIRELHQTVTADLQYQITNFLYLEARLLDQGKYNDWLDLLADDLDYRMLALRHSASARNRPARIG